MKTITTILCCLIFTASYTQQLEIDLYASGLSKPVNIKNAGDDRLFVVEQDGLIQIIDGNGSLLSTPFLDIDDKVVDLGGYDERGLLGLAFHPNYQNNRYFYVYYIDNNDNTVISRFERDLNNPSIADPNSELIILDFSQPQFNHNGGDIHFGEDGYLYIGSGDGGGSGDTSNNSQSLNTFLGKMLRIDVDNTNPPANYSIPADNPFINDPNALDEIWAYGIRNPWKFSFDRTTNEIWIADVGQNQIEEINMISATEAGLNYGWRCYEGNSPYSSSFGCPDDSTLTFPISQYTHSSGRCSITGGYVYRGNTYPNFVGLYFFADYCSDEIGYLTPDGNSWTLTLEDFSGNWSAFGEDVNGDLYISDLFSGNIYKLRDASLSLNENSLDKISIYPNPTTETLQINFANGFNNTPNKISIYSIQGKKIISVLKNENTTQTLNVSQLKSGVYILKIESENKVESTHKLIIN